MESTVTTASLEFHDSGRLCVVALTMMTTGRPWSLQWRARLERALDGCLAMTTLLGVGVVGTAMFRVRPAFDGRAGERTPAAPPCPRVRLHSMAVSPARFSPAAKPSPRVRPALDGRSRHDDVARRRSERRRHRHVSACEVHSMDGLAMTLLGSRTPTSLDATCTRWEVSP